jgi:acylglycerol lipase
MVVSSSKYVQKVSERLSTSIGTFEAPFLVQHGLSDIVTDPSLSKALYEESPSKDKSIKLYEGIVISCIFSHMNMLNSYPL